MAKDAIAGAEKVWLELGNDGRALRRSQRNRVRSIASSGNVANRDEIMDLCNKDWPEKMINGTLMGDYVCKQDHKS